MSGYLFGPTARTVLEELKIFQEIDENIDYIKEEAKKRVDTPLYQEYLEYQTPEENFFDIVPPIIHKLIKTKKIDEKKIDTAFDKIREAFPDAKYYGLLLGISDHVLERILETDENYLREMS